MSEGSDQESGGRTAVVVLSMHRSGTSAITRVLSLLGCTLPHRLISGRTNDNPTGFWESQAVVDLNKAICESAGSTWNDWKPLSLKWLESPAREQFVEQACKTLKSEFEDSQLFVLKDPRLCRLMPVWCSAFERLDITPKYILLVRNPFEVAASLRKRNNLNESGSHLAWLRHMLDAEHHSRDCPRLYVRYDDLLANWREVIDRVSGKLNLPWRVNLDSVADEINAFLAPNLRHHVVRDADVFDDMGGSPWVRQSYDIFIRWARDEFLINDSGVLDHISCAMNDSAPALDNVVSEVEALEEKITIFNNVFSELENNNKTLLSELEAADIIVREGAEKIKRIEEEKGSGDAKIKKLQEQVNQSRRQQSEAERALSEREAEFDDAMRQQKKLHSELLVRGEKMKDLHKELNELRRTIEEDRKHHRERLESSTAELAALSKYLQASEKVAAEAMKQAHGQLNDHMKLLDQAINGAHSKAGIGLNPFRRSRLRKYAANLANSTFFDVEWYLAKNPDVAQSGMDPAVHYIKHGFREGRAPNARFERTR